MQQRGTKRATSSSGMNTTPVLFLGITTADNRDFIDNFITAIPLQCQHKHNS